MPSFESDLTISLRDVEQMVADARDAEMEGFEVLKIKLGRDWREDFERLQGISRSVSCALRVDANQGWSVRDALNFMEQCAVHDITIDFLEQPVPASDLRGMAQIRNAIPCPLVADESVFSPEDALEVVRTEAADVVNIKLLKSGGIYQARKIAAIAEAAGLDCMIGCMMESPLGIAAAMQFASSVPGMKYYDLDLPYLLQELPEGSPVTLDGLSMTLGR